MMRIDPELQPAAACRHADTATINLWGAVFQLGVYDAAAGYVALKKASAEGKKVPISEAVTAYRWLRSADTHIGSFIWLCDLFDISADDLRALVIANAAKFGRKSIRP